VRNYTVTLRQKAPDENGRKNTKRIVVRARSKLEASLDAMTRYSAAEWNLISIEARDGSGT
jgi:hypothetical protein